MYPTTHVCLPAILENKAKNARMVEIPQETEQDFNFFTSTFQSKHNEAKITINSNTHFVPNHKIQNTLEKLRIRVLKKTLSFRNPRLEIDYSAVYRAFASTY